MANLSTSGLEELIGGFDAIAEIPDEVVLEMLVAEAEVIAPAQEAEARAMLSGKYSTGETAQSISYDKKLKKTSDGRAIYVYPKGTRRHGNKRRAAEVAFVGEGYHYAGVRTRARAVAEWLSGEGLLVFDDEPEKAYSAKVVGGISIEQIAVTGTCEVRFLCKPFAESLRYNQQDVKSVSLPHTEAVNVRGTQETDGLIYITARGNIQTLTITRLKVN